MNSTTAALRDKANHLTRSQRAMQIERRTSRQWMPARIGITIPSQTKPGVTYNTTLDACDCPDSRYRVGMPQGPSACKHVLAARLMFGRQSARERRHAA